MTGTSATVLRVLLIVYLAYGLLKLPGPFLRSEETKLRWLRRAYREGSRVVPIFDAAMLVFMAVLVGLQFAAGVEHVSFTTGLLVGMTLIQIFFHRFNEPLSVEQSPPPPLTPLKQFAFAVQVMPRKAWRELLFVGALSVWALVLLLTHGVR